MIIGFNAIQSLQAEWFGVIQVRDRVRHLVVSTFAYDTEKSPIFGDVLYNLPFQLAFDVLKKVLLQARDEQGFLHSHYPLEDLMDSAKTSLQWIDWPGLREAVQRRAQVEREGMLFEDIQCLKDIGDLETQLIAWGIIPVAKRSLSS